MKIRQKIKNHLPALGLLSLVLLVESRFSSREAIAGTVIVTDEVTLAVDKVKGALVQLPFAVKTLTPSRHFEISPAGGEGQIDVRLFQVRPLPGARQERVTFVLGNGKSVSLRLVTSDDSDGFYDLLMPSEKPKERNAKFLSTEIGLMKAMIKDEGGQYARQVKDEKVLLKNLGDFEARLVRLFASQGAFGFVFEIENDTDQEKRVPVTTLKVGTRTVLVYAEKDSLPPCKLFEKAACRTRVFVVTRGDSLAVLSSVKSDSGRSDQMPFVKGQDALDEVAQ
jgi:hypothetical protein